MNKLKTFDSEEFGQIRTVKIKGEPWFVAKDISDKLGYAQTSNMMKRIDEEDSKSSILDGMNMKSLLINESGLYSAIIGSKLESAKRFKHWVTSEVLPSIRKTGKYSISSEADERRYKTGVENRYIGFNRLFPFTSKSPVPRHADWYKRNLVRMHFICKEKKITLKELHEQIIGYVRDIYDWEEAQNMFHDEMCMYPQYQIDIISFFDVLAECANEYLDMIMIELNK